MHALLLNQLGDLLLGELDSGRLFVVAVLLAACLLFGLWWWLDRRSDPFRTFKRDMNQRRRLSKKDRFRLIK